LADFGGLKRIFLNPLQSAKIRQNPQQNIQFLPIKSAFLHLNFVIFLVHKERVQHKITILDVTLFFFTPKSKK
jgi:hypothetical protein